MNDFTDTYTNINTPNLNPKRRSSFNFSLNKLFSRPSENHNIFGSMGRPFKKISKKALVIATVIILLIIGLSVIFKNSLDSNNLSASNDQKLALPNAKASSNLNKEFTFPLRNEKNEEVSKLKFVIENAELRDEIVVKGQKATAIDGRTFLIVNSKIVNEHNQAVTINTRDYVRLSVNNKLDEMLAPDIHNDPVEVQAISTKYTRVGFPINDTDTNLQLHIGEIKGTKQTIDLNF